MLHPRARPFSPPSPLPSYPYPILHPFLGFLWFRLLKNIRINKNRKKIDRKKTSANLKLPNNLLCLASFVMQGKRTLTWSYPAQHTTRSADPSKLDLETLRAWSVFPNLLLHFPRPWDLIFWGKFFLRGKTKTTFQLLNKEINKINEVDKIN